MAAVMIAIDWENIRLGLLDHFIDSVSPDSIFTAFRDLAKEFGDYRGGAVFGDWTLRPTDARAFEERGLQAYNVLRSRSGKDRSDPAMMLEVYDWIRDKPHLGTIILGSGDSDFKELIRRGKQRGIEFIVFAVGATIASELPKMTGTFPVESRMNLTPKAPLTPLPGFPTTAESAKFRPLIVRLASVERKLPFVSFNYLKDTLLATWSIGQGREAYTSFLDEAEGRGLIEFDWVDNPNFPGKKTKAVHLNRTNDIVREILRGGGTGTA